jgi:parvulin-like peptidyl-prolyl isomerase
MARRSLLVLIALVALVVAGCGGDEGVPNDAVAVVDGEKVPRTAFDALISQAKKSFVEQKREFPKAGSTERKQLNDQAVEFLVQREQFAQEAADLDIEVTEKEIDARLKQIKQQYFGGDQKKYEKQLKDQGLTEAQVRNDVNAQIVQEELFNEVTKGIKVSDADVTKYYNDNKAQYGTPETREVRHILVKTKAKADSLFTQLKAGGDFAALAKKNSTDPGSKDNGGKLTITKGQTVAPFDQTAFLLKKNEVSRPVKTEYGFHIIQPLSAVKPAKTQALDKNLRAQIRQQLLTTKKQESMTKWVDELDKDYEDKVEYAVGFAPPAGSDSEEESGTTTGEE